MSVDERARREAGKATLSLRLLETRMTDAEKRTRALASKYEALMRCFMDWQKVNE